MLSSLVEFGDVIIYDWIEILELIMTEISSIDVYLELLLIGSWIDMIWNGKKFGTRKHSRRNVRFTLDCSCS